ncbi:MAG: peptidoglycan DD-metalloendopeptidase family protein [Lachnospiraceae bacterium]|nr:peptidoglycan DD-metalloendopeptidase family protein [Lachnospiraceae bacterium]
MKRKLKGYICATLLLALIITAVFTSDTLQVSATEAEISTGESSGESSSKKPVQKVDTDELEDQKQDTLDKIKDIKSDLEDVKNKIHALEQEKSNLQNYIAKLDQESNTLSAQIQELSDDIDAKKEEISQTKEELEEAERVADKQYEDMKIRIQYLYENRTPSYLELLLTAQNMADFLNRSSYAAEISRYDREMLDQYIAQKETIAETKEKLEAEEEELTLMSDAAKEQKEAVDALIQKKTAQIQSYQSQIESQYGEMSNAQGDLEEQERLLNQIEEQIAAAALANAMADDGDGGASGFAWPCPSSRRITSGFGPRSQPIAGASTNHKGIDIGASGGAAIIASAGGRVTTSTYSNSAGNYVVISHGNGISTVYMHCSALYVSVGDVVSQGQTIAAVGSTGFSTGNHLHFGVIKNGVYVNPSNYVG